VGHNTFGNHFSVTTFGESHGPALGVIVDGVESGFTVDLEAIQKEMDRRRPGGNPSGTERNEIDKLVILSGLYEGVYHGDSDCDDPVVAPISAPLITPI